MEKISEILSKEFKVSPTLSQFVDYINNEGFYLKLTRLIISKDSIYNNTFHKICLDLVKEYNEFLKKPITLSMLVPCKDNGEPFEEPKDFVNGNLAGVTQGVNNLMYEETKNKEVLFSGDWEVMGNYICKTDPYFELDVTDLGLIKNLTGQPITENYFKFLD